MGRIRILATAHSAAAPASVFALLQDGSTWPAWSMFDSFELERPGPVEPHGVGAIQVFITKVSKAREEIVELIQDRLSYVLLSGFPFRDYRADVDLLPGADGGTTITWRAAFDAKHFGTGWFWRRFMARVLAKTAGQLATAATLQPRSAYDSDGTPSWVQGASRESVPRTTPPGLP